MRRRLFTLEEANSLLPWLESKFTEIDSYREEMLKHQERYVELIRQSRRNGSTSKETEMHETQQKVEQCQQNIQRVLHEISRRGIIVRDAERGLVDFPSSREGREVHLCWLRGEPEIKFWHETDTGFAGRQPV